MDYLIFQDGKQSGPYSLEAIQGMVQKCSLAVTDLYWKQGMAEWLPISTLFPPPTPKKKHKSIGCGKAIGLFFLLVFSMSFFLTSFKSQQPNPISTTAKKSIPQALKKTPAEIVEIMERNRVHAREMLPDLYEDKTKFFNVEYDEFKLVSRVYSSEIICDDEPGNKRRFTFHAYWPGKIPKQAPSEFYFHFFSTDDEWQYLKNQSVIILCDTMPIELPTMKYNSDILSGGRVYESLFSEIRSSDFTVMCDAKVLKIRVGGDTFTFTPDQMRMIKAFTILFNDLP